MRYKNTFFSYFKSTDLELAASWKCKKNAYLVLGSSFGNRCAECLDKGLPDLSDIPKLAQFKTLTPKTENKQIECENCK